MNYRRITFLFLATLTLLEAKIIKQSRINPVIIEIFKTFIPIYSQEEQEFFSSLNPYDLKSTVETLNKLGQKYFLRPGHLSRLQPPELSEYYSRTLFPGHSIEEIEVLSKAMYDLFRESQYLQPIIPTYKNPQNILILGSTIMNMWERITFFNEMVEKGIITISESTKIIICVGERSLVGYEIKDLQKLEATHSFSSEEKIEDERTAGQVIFKIFPFSSKIKKANIQIIMTEKKPNTPRATTADRIKA